MPPKQAPAKGKQAPKQQKKPTGSSAGGKAKKKKWSKGKVRDKLNNMVLFDKATYEKLYKETVTYKLITPSVLSERLKIRVSLAKAALSELLAKGMIKLVDHHRTQLVYTRTTKTEDEKEAKEGKEATEGKEGGKGGKGKKGGKASKDEAKEEAAVES